MNRRQKIIVSVVGIFIVLLALVGLTYGYFLTRIQGNTNTTSITVTTADLKLTYGDGNENIETANAIMPGEDFKFIRRNENGDVLTDESGNTILYDSKTFTVTNEGDATSYVVLIDGDGDLSNEITPVIVKYASSGTTRSGVNYSEGDTTTFVSNDFVYTLTCKSVNATTGAESGECNGQNFETSFPMNGGVVVGNNIAENIRHEYELKIKYLETNEDQTDDMNKTLEAQVNIADIKGLNPYKDNTDSLAYNIINNSVTAKNGTQLLATPETKVAEEKSYTKGSGKMVEQELDLSGKTWFYGTTDINARPWNGGSPLGSGITTCSSTIEKKYISYPTVGESWYVKSCKSETIAVVEVEEMEYESSIQTTQDDLGTSYYYRGNVEDNYVNFAGMCWRIVRIAGDGSTKLILEDQYTTCDDIEDTDGEGTTDYAYSGNWNIGTGNYGYESKNVDSDSDNEYIMSYLNPVTNNTSSMVKAFYDFQTTKLADYTGKLKSGDWCLGDKAYTRSGSSSSYTYAPLEEYNYSSSMYYDAYTRLKSGNVNGYQPTLKCNGTVLDKFATVSGVSNESPMYVSAITADEIAYAGGKYEEANIHYYLINNYQRSNNGNYFWSLSPFCFDGNYANAFYVHNNNSLAYYNVVNDNFAFRPSVSLASSAVISEGEGTLESPYVIG